MFWKFLKKPAEPAVAKTSNVPLATLSASFLSKLIPIGELPEAQLRALSVVERQFLPGDIVFNRGDSSDTLIYLKSGTVFLEAGDGSGYSVEDSVFKACYPLSGQEHQFTAIAKTALQILYVPYQAIRQSNDAQLAQPLPKAESLPSGLAESSLFQGFYVALQNEQLQVPTLPDVALRLRKALQQDDISISDAAKIVNLDPSITSKLIQVANSPVYGASVPLTTCQDAMTRLGVQTTQNIVTSVSLRNLFRSANPRLNQYIHHLWKQSIQVASLSYALAHLTRKINPDEALLAGLIHNIGALPIVAYAETAETTADLELLLTQMIVSLQGPVGRYLLQKWHFPQALQEIPVVTSYWYHDSGSQLQLSDIVLLARFHYQLSLSKGSKLPPLCTLPAFQKIGDKTLTPDLSLRMLTEANQQIAETMRLFNS